MVIPTVYANVGIQIAVGRSSVVLAIAIYARIIPIAPGKKMKV